MGSVSGVPGGRRVRGASLRTKVATIGTGWAILNLNPAIWETIAATGWRGAIVLA